MKYFNFDLVLKRLICGLFFFGAFSAMSQDKVSIIPRPAVLDLHEGAFLFSGHTSINFDRKDRALTETALYLRAYVHHLAGYELLLNAPHARSTVVLQLVKDTSLYTEGYRLEVASQRIRIQAGTTAGLYYGLQSIIQTMPPIRTNARLSVPCLTVKDVPRFSWRGMHLDVSRHFWDMDMIKEILDLMAAYKMNTFHWHLVDDQGWRIEIRKYPRLTDIGAWRSGTPKGRDAGQGSDNRVHGGYYTQEQVREIVRYAAARHITVIPELEMPGHSSAAIAAYPYLSCFPAEKTRINAEMTSSKAVSILAGGGIKVVPETWGVYDDVLCAGSDSSFQFIEDVLDELLALFPSKIIHVGGDECPKSNWKRCVACQQRIVQYKLKNEHELQSYFIKRIEKYLTSKGRTLVGWDEILEGGLAPDAIVMSWRGEEGGIEAASMEHFVVMSPQKALLFRSFPGWA